MPVVGGVKGEELTASSIVGMASGGDGVKGELIASSIVGSCLLGLFSSSKVTPSSFVIPTTAGSPFLTNSYWPMSTY